MKEATMFVLLFATMGYVGLMMFAAAVFKDYNVEKPVYTLLLGFAVIWAAFVYVALTMM
jgi:hypothetical protein